MKNKYTCPPHFNISRAGTYQISQAWNKNHETGECDNIEFICLSKGTTQYYFASGRIWKQVPFDQQLEFETVHHGENPNLKPNIHYHTEFLLEDDVIHIDYVLAWGSGPGSRQDNVKIYLNNELLACGIIGGSSLGANWGRKYPPKAVHRDMLLIFEARLNASQQNLIFRQSDENFPVKLFKPIALEETPFKIYDFVHNEPSHAGLDPLNVESLKPNFKKEITADLRREILVSILNRIRGKLLSSESLSDVISSILWQYAFKGAAIDLDSTTELSLILKDYILEFGYKHK
jgi:hypothetical protein